MRKSPQPSKHAFSKSVQLLNQALSQALVNTLLEGGRVSAFERHLKVALATMPEMAGDYVPAMQHVIAGMEGAVREYVRDESEFYGRKPD